MTRGANQIINFGANFNYHSQMDEQEQNGVTVPNKAESVLAQIPRYRPRIARLRSGGKKL
jgi:hypothetical protein